MPHGIDRRALIKCSGGLLLGSLCAPAYADAPSPEPKAGAAPEATVIDQLLHATLRIACSGPSGDRLGTGLIFTLLGNAPFLVTSRQLLTGATSCQLSFTQASPDGLPQAGAPIPVRLDDVAGGVIMHPDADVDLAILPMAPVLRMLQGMGKTAFFRAAGPSLIPTPTQLQHMASFQDVFTLGYPGQVWDKVNNLPLMVSGATASPPALDFDGKREFLISGQSWLGGIASPVFAYHRAGIAASDGQNGGDWIYLIGIVYASVREHANGTIDVQAVPFRPGEQASLFSDVTTPVNLSVCMAASRILEFEAVLRKRGAEAAYRQ